MASVNIKLNTRRVKKNDYYPVIIEIHYKGKRTRKGLGVDARLDQWSEEQQNILHKKHSGGKILYLDIQKKRIALLEKIHRAELNNVSAEQFFNNLEGEDYTLFGFTKIIVEELESVNKVGNARAYRGLLDQLKKVKEDVLLIDVDYNYINDFKQIKYVAGNSNNTLRYYLKTFRAVINEAVRRGYFDKGKYPFIKGLMPKAEATAKRFLTADDVEKLESYTTKWPGERRALDTFLLGFYLRGADIVDLAHLTTENIKRNRLEYRRQKSGQILSIQLLSKANKIINTYKGGKYLLPLLDGPMVDDIIKYQIRVKNLNRSLKIIGAKLGLPITLTTKVNRHSWATIAKTKGVPKDVIKEALGHQDRTVTDVYLGAYDVAVLDEANLLVCG